MRKVVLLIDCRGNMVGPVKQELYLPDQTGATLSLLQLEVGEMEAGFDVYEINKNQQWAQINQVLLSCLWERCPIAQSRKIPMFLKVAGAFRKPVPRMQPCRRSMLTCHERWRVTGLVLRRWSPAAATGSLTRRAGRRFQRQEPRSKCECLGPPRWATLTSSPLVGQWGRRKRLGCECRLGHTRKILFKSY